MPPALHKADLTAKPFHLHPSTKGEKREENPLIQREEMSESGKREQSERDKDSVRVRRDKKGERREKKSIDSKKG